MSDLVSERDRFKAFLSLTPAEEGIDQKLKYFTRLSKIRESADLTDPQTVCYLMAYVAPTGKDRGFEAFWSAYTRFRHSEGQHLSPLPEKLSVVFSHPLAVDVIRVRLEGTRVDPRLRRQAEERIRCFVEQERMGNPPDFVWGAIESSRYRRTLYFDPDLHDSINVLLADTGAPVAVSTRVYKYFQHRVGRRVWRNGVNPYGQFDQWRDLIQRKEFDALESMIRDYCVVPDDSRLGGILFR